jgi:hypothetical protein
VEELDSSSSDLHSSVAIGVDYQHLALPSCGG